MKIKRFKKMATFIASKLYEIIILLSLFAGCATIEFNRDIKFQVKPTNACLESGERYEDCN